MSYDYNIDWERLYDLDEASFAISSALKDGNITLFLGAGVSQNFGLPGWAELVKRCCDKKTIEWKEEYEKSNEKLLLLMSDIRRECDTPNEYKQIIKDCLYDHGKIEYSKRFLQNELLFSIGALTIGIIHPRVQSIVNFNFDDLIEYYFELYGTNIQIITSFPILRNSSNICLYHLNGFLPLNKSYIDSENIIFDQKAIDKSISNEIGNPWYVKLNSILLENICVFIGLSSADTFLRTAIHNAHEIILDKRPVGFWLYRKDSNKEFNKSYWRELGIIRLDLQSHADYSEFLLKTCRFANANQSHEVK